MKLADLDSIASSSIFDSRVLPLWHDLDILSYNYVYYDAITPLLSDTGAVESFKVKAK